jgi:hypothetical protein
MIPLATAARDAGREVIFATDAIRPPLPSGIGLDVIAAGRSTDEVVEEAVRGVRADTWLRRTVATAGAAENLGGVQPADATVLCG